MTGRPFHGWRIVGVLAVTETVSWGVLYYSFSVFLGPMRRDLGLSTAVVSGAFSVAVVVMGLAALPVGRWLDRRGARGLMTSGSLLAVGAVAAWSQVRTPAQLYAAFVLLGLAGAMVLYEPAFAVVVRWFDGDRAGDRGRALLVVALVAGFASTIFVPTAATLEHALGWREALLVLAGILAVTTVVPHALVLRRDPAAIGLAPAGRDARRAAGVAAGSRGRSAGVWQERRFRLLTLAFALHTLAVVVVAVHLFPFLREQGHGAGFAAAATGGLGALSVTGRLVVTGIFARLPIAQVTAGVFAVQAVAVAVLLLDPASSAAAVVFVVLFGLGFGVGTIARPALVVEEYGVARYATVSAIMGLALTAAKVVGPVAAGAARTAGGDYTVVLVGLGIVSLLASGALVAAHRTDRADLPVSRRAVRA